MSGKCCQKCAFRNGSPERCLPDKWEELMMEILVRERDFYCHETSPTHAQANKDRIKDGPQLCAGYAAFKKTGLSRMLKLQQQPENLDLDRYRSTIEMWISKTDNNNLEDYNG